MPTTTSTKSLILHIDLRCITRPLEVVHKEKHQSLLLITSENQGEL